MAQLKNSEKRLIFGFGLVMFILGNLFLFNFGKKKMGELQRDLDNAESNLQQYEPLLEEKIQWEKRRAWLDAEQPFFTTEEDKAPKLQQSINDMAQLTGVEVTMKPLEHGVEAYHQHIGIIGDVKGTAEQVLRFASLLQDQGKFREVNSFTIKSEKNDPSLLVLQFTMTELYSLNSPDPVTLETAEPTEPTEATAPTGTSGEPETLPLPAG
jgi:hypothetical protein